MIRRLCWFFVGVFIVSVPMFAFAAAGPIWGSAESFLIKFASDGSVMTVPGKLVPSDAVADGLGGATAKATQSLRVGGAGATLNLAKPISKFSLAKAAGAAARSFGPIALAELAYGAYLIYDSATGDWSAPGTVDPTYPQGCWQDTVNAPTGCFASPQRYCDARGALMTFGPLSVRLNGDQYECYRPGPNSWQVLGYPDLKEPCVLAGWAWDESVGGCREAPSVPVTDTEMDDAISTSLENDPTNSTSVLDRLTSLGFRPDTGPMEVSGPSTIPGPTTTSTTSGPSGITTTTKTTNFDIDYNGDTVTVTQNTTTTVVDPSGNTTTTDTTTDPGSGDPPPVEEEQPTLCEDHPDISACQELGAPESKELDNEDQDLEFNPEDFGMVGSCPADKPFTHAGFSFSLSWAPVCTFAEGIRPMMIAINMLAAGIFIFAAARGLK